MTRGALVIFVLAVVVAASLWLFVFVVAPAASRSRFALKLTEIRDDVEDKYLLIGPYADDEQITNFFRLVDDVIEHASGFTVANMVTLRRALVRERIEPEPVTFDWGAYPPDVRESMTGYVAEFAIASARYLVFGSLSGWLFGIYMLVSTGTGALRTRTTEVASEPLGEHPFTQRALTDYDKAIQIEPTLLDRKHRHLVGAAAH